MTGAEERTGMVEGVQPVAPGEALPTEGPDGETTEPLLSPMFTKLLGKCIDYVYIACVDVLDIIFLC